MRLAALVLVCAVALSAPLRAEEAVPLDGGLGLFDRPARVAAAVVLVPGGDGYLGIQPAGSFSGLRGNQVVRTRRAYVGQGIATLLVDANVSLDSAVAYLRRLGRPVAVIATSRGTLRVASALGSRPNGLVLTSSFLDNIQSSVGTASALPLTLVIHHRQDRCRLTPPDAVEPFARWGGSRVRVAWIDGGTDGGDPCQAAGHHGFAGQDGAVVGAAARFVKSLR